MRNGVQRLHPQFAHTQFRRTPDPHSTRSPRSLAQGRLLAPAAAPPSAEAEGLPRSAGLWMTQTINLQNCAITFVSPLLTYRLRAPRIVKQS